MCCHSLVFRQQGGPWAVWSPKFSCLSHPSLPAVQALLFVKKVGRHCSKASIAICFPHYWLTQDLETKPISVKHSSVTRLAQVQMHDPTQVNEIWEEACWRHLKDFPLFGESDRKWWSLFLMQRRPGTAVAILWSSLSTPFYIWFSCAVNQKNVLFKILWFGFCFFHWIHLQQHIFNPPVLVYFMYQHG